MPRCLDASMICRSSHCNCTDGMRRTHRAPDHSDFPFPKEIFQKFVTENDGARVTFACPLCWG